MNPSGPRKYRKIAPDCGCRPGPISISTSCSTRKCQFLKTSLMVSTWKFMWHRPGPSPRKTASLWCTGSIRIRQAASPSQSDTRALKRVLQNRYASCTSGASRQRWPNSVIPAPRLKATGRATVSCWLTSSTRLPNGSSKAMNSRTRRDLASASDPRCTLMPDRSSSVSAALSASESATRKPEEMTPEGPSTRARQWCRWSARRWVTPTSVGVTNSRPTMSVAKRVAASRSATPDLT